MENNMLLESTNVKSSPVPVRGKGGIGMGKRDFCDSPDRTSSGGISPVESALKSKIFGPSKT